MLFGGKRKQYLRHGDLVELGERLAEALSRRGRSPVEERRDRWMVACAAAGVVATMSVGGVSTWAALQSVDQAKQANEHAQKLSTDAARQVAEADNRSRRIQAGADFTAGARQVASESISDRLSGLLALRSALTNDEQTYKEQVCPVLAVALQKSALKFSTLKNESVYSSSEAATRDVVLTFSLMDAYCAGGREGKIEYTFNRLNLSGRMISEVSIVGLSMDFPQLSNFRVESAKFPKISIGNCKCSGIFFDRVLLEDADLGALEMNGAQMNNVDLTRATFNYSAIRKSFLNSTNLNSSNLENLDFSESSWTDVSVKSSQMRAMLFRKTVFEDVDFSNSIIEDSSFDVATFRNVDFSGVDLTSSNLRNARFFACKYDGHTAWPKDFKIPRTCKKAGNA